MSVYDNHVSYEKTLTALGMLYCEGCSGWFTPMGRSIVRPSKHDRWVKFDHNIGEVVPMMFCEGCEETATDRDRFDDVSEFLVDIMVENNVWLAIKE